MGAFPAENNRLLLCVAGNEGTATARALKTALSRTAMIQQTQGRAELFQPISVQLSSLCARTRVRGSYRHTWNTAIYEQYATPYRRAHGQLGASPAACPIPARTGL